MFKEPEGEWHENAPAWVEALMRFGHDLAVPSDQRHRFFLISMPCDSPAAGLVALGAMRRFLSLKQDGVREWLASGRDSNLVYRDGRYRFVGDADDGKVVLEEIVRKDYRRSLARPRTPMTITTDIRNLRFEDDVFFEVSPDDQLPNTSIYEGLVDGAPVIRGENLRQSDFGICLAGRRRGLRITRELMEKTFFCDGHSPTSLAALLSLVDGSLDVVSRTTLFNTRTGRMDRYCPRPKIVVADGIDAFLTVLGEKQKKQINQFYSSVVVGIVDLTAKREKLELLRDKVSNLLQWYEVVDPFAGSPGPRGMEVVSYVQKGGAS